MTDLDDELAQLRADVAVPEAVQQRVAARLAHSIGASAVGSLGGSRTLAPPPRPFALANPLQIAASLLIGGAIGATSYGALRPPRVERVYIERPAPTQAAIAPSAVSEPQQPEPAVVAVPSAKALTTTVPSASNDRDATLAEQRALLDVARAAFTRSDYAETLAALTTHVRRFPKSQLAEEREALEIKALAASGRAAEARARAALFRARHPQSLLLLSIDGSLRDNP